VRPAQGPCGADDRRPCRLVESHKRQRKTGPCIALSVLRCQTHGLAFTLYPPGHFPYGRKPAVRVGLDRSPVRVDAESESRTDTLFEGTIFDAAMEAARGMAWDRRRDGGSNRWWQTQRRQIEVALLWLGLLPSLTAAVRERVSVALGVPLLLVREQVTRLRNAPGYRARGAAVTAVLSALPGGSPLDRLAWAGHLVGLWAAPSRCDRRGFLRRSPFWRGDPRAPPARSIVADPNHESET